MLKIKKSTLIIFLVLAMVVGSGLTMGGIILAKNAGKDLDKPDYDQLFMFYEKYSKLEELEQYVNQVFYEDVDQEKLEIGAAKGLIEGLGDPYSSYMTMSEYEEWKGLTSGKYDGIGVTFMENEKGNMVVVSVNKNSPAEEAGIKPGDYLLTVDGESFENSDEMASHLRGKAGTRVEITYYRNGKTKNVTLTRKQIINESVEYKVLDDNIGYIRISAFEEDTGEDFDRALGKLDDEKVDGLVIDLRNNGGGLVEACIVVADDILPKGKVVSMKNKYGKELHYDSNEIYTKIPYVLLVNGETASASEIVTAAVKDYGTGKIIGTKTFGKGIVQSTRKLRDGDALKLTIEQYFSPKGHKIHKKGIEPDIVIEDDENTEKDEQLDKAIEVLKKGNKKQ